MNRILLLIPFILFSLLSFGQNSEEIDSLNQVFIHAKHDTVRLACLNDIGVLLFRTNPDSCILVNEVALKIAEKAYEASTEEMAETYAYWVGNMLYNLAFLYKVRGDIPKSLEYNLRSITIREEIGDKQGIAYSLHNIAVIHQEQDDFDKALEYFERSVEIKGELNDSAGISMTFQNIGGIYEKKGDELLALSYYKQGVAINEELGSKVELGRSLLYVGNTLCNMDSMDEGISILVRGYNILDKLQDKRWISYSAELLGYKYMKIDQMDSAVIYANRSMELALELDFPKNIEAAAACLHSIYKRQEKFEKALEMYELKVVMGDSVKNEATQKAAIRQQTKYEFEKVQLVKEQEEKEGLRLESEATSRRDNLQYSVILIALLVIGGLLTVIGRFSIPMRVAEGLIFFAFLIFFEFILVLGDPYIETWTSGAPGLKLLINAAVAAMIFPLHAFFESKLKARIAG